MLDASCYLIHTVHTSTDHAYLLSDTSPVPLFGRVTVRFTEKKLQAFENIYNQDCNQVGHEGKDKRNFVMSCKM